MPTNGHRSVPSRIHQSNAPFPSGGILRDCTESLQQEDDEGAVEYKWRLVGVTKARFQHLVTQMKFRVGEGDGECIYELGVEDNGHPRGLIDDDFDESVSTLQSMARHLKYRCSVVYERLVCQKPRLRCAEVRVCDMKPRIKPYKVALLGPEGSGKTSLCASIIYGISDDGAGSARQRVLRHEHELLTGNTTCSTSALLGFDANGGVLNFDDGSGNVNALDSVELNDATISRSSSIAVQLVDLPGRLRNRRSCVSNVLHIQPDAAVLVLDGTAPLPERVGDFFAICSALKLHFAIAVMKHDAIGDPSALIAFLAAVQHELHAAGIKAVPKYVAEGSSCLRCESDDEDFIADDSEIVQEQTIPLFTVSTRTRHGLLSLTSWLREQALGEGRSVHGLPEVEVRGVASSESGTILRGTVTNGEVKVGCMLTAGPLAADGSCRPLRVLAIRASGLLTESVSCGADASMLVEGSGAASELWLSRGRQRPGAILRCVHDGIALAASFHIRRIGPDAAWAGLGRHVYFLCGGSRVMGRVFEGPCTQDFLVELDRCIPVREGAAVAMEDIHGCGFVFGSLVTGKGAASEGFRSPSAQVSEDSHGADSKAAIATDSCVPTSHSGRPRRQQRKQKSAKI